MKSNVTLERFTNCLLKAYVFEDGGYTLKTRKARKAVEMGQKVCLAVHVQGEGDWITSPIVSIEGKEVKTKHHIYDVKGVAKPHKVSSCFFFIDSPDSNNSGKKQFSIFDPSEMTTLISYLDLECPISAEVTYPDGTCNITNHILELDVVHKVFRTASYSLYKVKGSHLRNW